MDKFRVQDLLEICEELGLSVGPAMRKRQILELMEAEEVSVEEADEAQEAILERIEKELAEKLRERRRKLLDEDIRRIGQWRCEHNLKTHSRRAGNETAAEREPREREEIEKLQSLKQESREFECELPVLDAHIDRLKDRIAKKKAGEVPSDARLEPVVAEDSGEEIVSPDRDARAEPVAAEDYGEEIVSPDRDARSEPVADRSSEEPIASAGREARAEPVPAQGSGEPLVSADRYARNGSGKLVGRHVDCPDRVAGSVLALSSESWPQLPPEVDKETCVAKPIASLTQGCLRESVEGPVTAGRGGPQTEASEAGGCVVLTKTLGSEPMVVGKGQALELAEAGDDECCLAQLFERKHTLSFAEERGREANPREPYGNESSPRTTAQHGPLGCSSLEAFVGPGSQRSNAVYRPRSFDCKSQGIGALPLECAAMPKRRDKRSPRNSQNEKRKKERENSQIAACKARETTRRTVKGKLKRVRETMQPLSNPERGQERPCQRDQSRENGFRGTFRRTAWKQHREKYVRCRRVRHGAVSHSSLRPLHFETLGERCASSFPPWQRPPPYTVRCSLQGMSREGRPKWRQRLGRFKPRAFVMPGA